MNKTVLITGASAGIGLELARVFANNGYDLIVVARSEDKLLALKQELADVAVHLIVQDLSQQGAGQLVYNQVKKLPVEVNVLVNNAGFGDYGLFHTLNLDKQTQMIDLNVRTLTELTHLFGKDMVERKEGKILQVASVAAFFPGPLMSVYFATKHYVLALSEALANEWKGFGVTVTALCPGPTQSEFFSDPHFKDSSLAKGKNLPTAKEVAEYGFNALQSGKAIAVHGFMNKLQVFFVRLAPRNAITSIVRKLQK
jgi:uncharacterized protein